MATQLSSQQSSVSIYCDYQNVYLDEKSVGFLQNFANSRGKLLSTKVYYNPLDIKKFLEFPNVTCIVVPYSSRNSSDKEIVFDLIRDVPQSQSSETIILVSGDGDFIGIVETLKRLGKHVIVFA